MVQGICLNIQISFHESEFQIFKLEEFVSENAGIPRICSPGPLLASDRFLQKFYIISQTISLKTSQLV